jgi:hypothetical protein
VFLLYAFSNGKQVVITRGDSCDVALHHAASAFSRGETVCPLDYVPIDAASMYSENHPFDWLNTSPRYLNS